MNLEPPDPPPSDEDDSETVESAPVSPKKKPAGTASATMLGAAMLAMGEILEPEKTTVEIVQTNDDPIDDLPFNLDFGELPPLD